MSIDKQRYAIIAGNGRSGTTWLLTILDASPETFCRNEPDTNPESPFHQLPDALAIQKKPELMEQPWDFFVQWTATHLSEWDLKVTAPKHHLHALPQALGLTNLPFRPKARNLLQKLSPGIWAKEWSAPGWMVNQKALHQSYAVFKFNIEAWYACWLLEYRPETPVVHMVRHPGGFLHSAITRFFSKLSPEKLEKEYQLYTDILRTAVAIAPEWGAVFGDIESMELMEAVAWVWRYHNEAIYRTGQGQPNYLRLIYEDMSRQPLAMAQQVYQHCDLDWSADIENRIKAGLDTSVWGKLSKSSVEVAEVWKSELSPENLRLIHQVMEGSLMADWWS